MNGCRPAKCQRPSRVDGFVQGLKTRKGSKVFKEVKFVLRGQIPSGVYVHSRVWESSMGSQRLSRVKKVSVHRERVYQSLTTVKWASMWVRRGVSSQIRGEGGNYSGAVAD